MKRTIKLIIFGVLTWLIPFVVSCAFYNRQEQVLIDVFLFKSIMIVVGAFVGAFFLVWYFRKITRHYLYHGLVVGLAWLVINWMLDFAILIPLSGMSISTYFMQIGLRYLTLPIMGVAIGWALQKKSGTP